MTHTQTHTHTYTLQSTTGLFKKTSDIS